MPSCQITPKGRSVIVKKYIQSTPVVILAVVLTIAITMACLSKSSQKTKGPLAGATFSEVTVAGDHAPLVREFVIARFEEGGIRFNVAGAPTLKIDSHIYDGVGADSAESVTIYLESSNGLHLIAIQTNRSKDLGLGVKRTNEMVDGAAKELRERIWRK